MKIKICGIQTVEDALLTAKAQPDFIGMVFAPSKRQIEISQAAEITQALTGTGIKTVGVFVNPSKEEVEAAIKAGVDYIQFHGDEEKAFVETYKNRAIKAFPSNSDLSYQERFDYNAAYILIDSPREKYYGGSGTVFNWSEIPLEAVDTNRLGLAGGLNPDNINLALKEITPALIDASSGVETDGKKDEVKIREFIKQIRSGNHG